MYIFLPLEIQVICIYMVREREPFGCSSRVLIHCLHYRCTMISMKENQNQYQFPHSTVQTETNEQCSIGGSSNHHVVDQTKQILINKQGRTQSSHDQVQINQASSRNSINNDSSNEIIRACSNCKTTKTPLWRGGPQGPKSLCNACGIRQMKARRAMRAAAGLTNCKLQEEGSRSDVDRTVPFKKRFKINVTSASAQTKLPFDEITISLSSKSAFQQAFPQEEKDAAVLLMALSCGLIHG